MYGTEGRYFAEEHGYNSRLDELHAEILRRKLRRLDGYIERRRALARHYDAALGHSGLQLPVTAPGNRHVYYLYVVRHLARDAILRELAARDILVNVSYRWAHSHDAGLRARRLPGRFPARDRAGGVRDLLAADVPLADGCRTGSRLRGAARDSASLLDVDETLTGTGLMAICHRWYPQLVPRRLLVLARSGLSYVVKLPRLCGAPHSCGNLKPRATSSTSCSTCSRRTPSSRSWTPTGPPSIATGPASVSSQTPRRPPNHDGSMSAMLSGVAFRNEVPFPRVPRSPSIRLPRTRTTGLSPPILTSYRNGHPSPSFPGAGAALFYWSLHEVELWEREQ